MPIPLIVWGGVVAVSAVGGGVALVKSISRMKKAKERYKMRWEAYQRFVRKYESAHGSAKRTLDLLGEERLKAAVVLGQAVEFLQNATLKDRDLELRYEVTPQKMADWQKVSINAIEVLGGAARAGACGAATAAGASGLVGTLASASTGTAISTLSGAAASNATLAWLGGGTLAAGGGGVAAGTLVLGGLAAGPALVAIGFVATKEASKVETQVEEAIAELDVDQRQKKLVIAQLDVLEQRADELRERTGQTRSELENLLETCDAAVDEDAYMVAQAASALGQMLEIAIIDEDGTILEDGDYHELTEAQEAPSRDTD